MSCLNCLLTCSARDHVRAHRRDPGLSRAAEQESAGKALLLPAQSPSCRSACRFACLVHASTAFRIVKPLLNGDMDWCRSMRQSTPPASMSPRVHRTWPTYYPEQAVLQLPRRQHLRQHRLWCQLSLPAQQHMGPAAHRSQGLQRMCSLFRCPCQPSALLPGRR